MILAIGLRFVGLGDTIAALMDIYGTSRSSTKRAINMFLDAVDYNTSLEELQVRLPDPEDEVALQSLARRWASKSTAFGLFTNTLGAVDGWLPQTEMPGDVTNQTDYFSGHYQCYGLNIQAVCDPDLAFLYLAVAAPGKVNDARAFGRCSGLISWLEALPDLYHILGDGAYPLSRKVLIPFSGAEANEDYKRTYNYYLSQLRIRIEMAFGRLTTKWRILRRAMNYSNQKNAKIIRVCAKLHNFCIRMQQLEEPAFFGETVEPAQHGIDRLEGGGNRSSDFGFLETSGEDDTVPPPLNNYSSLSPDASLRESCLADVSSRGLRRPPSNVARNNR